LYLLKRDSSGIDDGRQPPGAAFRTVRENITAYYAPIVAEFNLPRRLKMGAQSGALSAAGKGPSWSHIG
jgi:hypothetical protein